MSEVKHTTGPWIVIPHWNNSCDDRLEIKPVFDGPPVHGEWASLAEIHNYEDQVVANARLIAAAPELLEALKALTPPELNSSDWWCPECKDYTDATFSECCTHCGTSLTDCQPSEEWHTKALAAIRKAEGATND
ncbi:hypothetical protein [Kiloniella majae]|uniref:hypothetical protein n=1 Tax=Kiloniella majae TaxID=1938558 RepID=UPI000A277A63|nr:hypothetical protein [Kiloniella majae]